MIRKAEESDLDVILDIYQAARRYMKKSGNEHQWGDSYPSVDLLKDDIDKKQLYVFLENNTIHGVFAFIVGEEPTYHHIESGAWKNSKPYGTIHRMASDGAVKGVFEICLKYCKGLCSNIRIDTHQQNTTMQHLIKKNGFEKCGIIYVADGSPRIAFQSV